jgi:hypothetical protein
MIQKGIVSSLSENNIKARIVLPKFGQFVTPELQICPHVGEINIGDSVIVAFYDSDMQDGAIIGKVT